MTSPRPKPTKRCFVTVGATASFISLIQNVLQPTFLEALKLHNYTELRIQYGKNGKKTFDDYCWLLSDELKKSLEIEITGFDFNKTGLKEEMLAAKRIYTTSTMKGSEGCVISHAGEYTVQYMGGQMAGNVADEQALGSGSILEAMRIEVPVIVVPNTDLLDNHQVELAEVLAEQNYVVHGSLSNLGEALPAVEEMRRKKKAWPPIVGTNEKTPRQALTHVMDDELGWVD